MICAGLEVLNKAARRCPGAEFKSGSELLDWGGISIFFMVPPRRAIESWNPAVGTKSCRFVPGGFQFEILSRSG